MFRKALRLLVILISVSALVAVFLCFQGNTLARYLSNTKKVNANIFVVEGWLSEDALKLAYAEHIQNNYELIVTTGLKKSPYNTSAIEPNKKQHHKYSVADNAKSTLIKIGVDSTKIIAVPCEYTAINRTLTSAKAFREWAKTTNLKIKGINVVSSGAHARRSHLTYSKLLGKSYPVGIISLPGEERENRRLYILYQALDLVYYWFILIPY